MTANGNAQEAFAPVLSALSTLQSNIDRSQKAEAHGYLEKFQKSPEAWSTTYGILQSTDASVEVKLFAATTLKGKITYDLHQVPRDSLPPLRDTLIQLLSAQQPKPLRTQLCVSLALLAIQMLEWKNPLQQIVQSLSGQQGIPAMLEFLHVLPEEVTEGRKINLSEDELNERTVELLQDNAQTVLQLLVQYAQSSSTAAKDPQLIDCIASWLREIDIGGVMDTPLLPVVLNALNHEESFDASVECISAMIAETRDVDECLNTIEKLYPHVLAIQPNIAKAADAEDSDKLKGITRIFAEAGETWTLLIARLPQQFRSLVESILECAARDIDREVVALTFRFWYELKQYIVLDQYIEARAIYADLFSKLMDVMIRHIEFPSPENANQKDLFDGDREQEDKFREFRHQMGDVLKDCCEVLGSTECLRKPYDLIEKWVSLHGSEVQQGRVPAWQSLEAPLFAMRAMGREIEPDEKIMLPRLIPLITQIPDQEKIRFQALMVIGRYTEWTARHPETLKEQLDYVMAAFEHPSKDVVQAAALAFQFCCSDCAVQLRDFIPQLQNFYERVINRLPFQSQSEITEGIAAVIAIQPNGAIYRQFKLCADPVVERIKQMAQSATTEPKKLELADHIKLVTMFVQRIQPHVEKGQSNPAVQYCQEIFPVLAKLVELFASFSPILERVCHCWRHMVLSYRGDIAPLLPQLLEELASGFRLSRQGCFLWATDAIIQESSLGAEGVDANTTNAIFDFAEQQMTTFLRILNDLPPDELPDIIEDFFRMASNLVLFYPIRTLSSPLMEHVLGATSPALTLAQQEPLVATLQFLRDFLSYGGEQAPTSVPFPGNNNYENPPAAREATKHLLVAQGGTIAQRVIAGMMYSFPQDCFPDASGVLLQMFQLQPQVAYEWLKTTLGMLPEGSITPQEKDRVLNNVSKKIETNDQRSIRTVLQDFTNSYRRRNVAPREGLGRLEATRFRFAG